MTMTPKQAELLDLVKTVRIKGICINLVWRWIRCDTGHTVNARTVKALERAGHIKISYYRGGEAGVNAK